MNIYVTLSYPDEFADHRLPPSIEVDALPPIGSEVNVVENRFVVRGVHLDVRGNGSTFYTIQLESWETR